MVDVTVGDATFQVPKEVGEHFRDGERTRGEIAELKKQNAALSLEIQKYLDQNKKEAGIKEAGSRKELTADLLWEDTGAFIALLNEQLAKRAEDVKQSMRTEYQQEVTWKDFWSDFWAENREFNKAEDAAVAEMLIRKNLADWQDLSLPEARKKLSSELKKVIANYQKREERKREEPPHVESGFGGFRMEMPEKSGTSKGEEETSLSAVLRERAEKRRSAMRP